MILTDTAILSWSQAREYSREISHTDFNWYKVKIDCDVDLKVVPFEIAKLNKFAFS